MKKIIILIITILALTSCSNPDTTLINNGYTIKEDMGISLIGCGEDDSIFNSKKYKVEKDGVTQTVRVCCGLLFKGCVIRY